MIIRKISLIVGLVILGFSLQAQYEFKTEFDVSCSNVKNQNNTGTCWSFSTISFLESEVQRITGKSIDLSEMSIVYTIYKDKARNFVLRHGKAQFSEGGLSHDVINAVRLNGVVPESVFAGNKDENGKYNHEPFMENIKTLLNGFIDNKSPSPNWNAEIQSHINEGIGALPMKFTYEDKGYTPKSFSESLMIQPDDYVTITSFSHHPFYSQFILEIPDNYSNGSYYNVPLKELYGITFDAIKKGFSVAWDTDVSEKGFSARHGLAVIPLNDDFNAAFANPVPEKNINQKGRQADFESFATTDDHLMHITGIARDQDNRAYFVTKNSWGQVGPYKGIIYASKSYFDAKTIAIMVHKDALPENLKNRLGIK